MAEEDVMVGLESLLAVDKASRNRIAKLSAEAETVVGDSRLSTLMGGMAPFSLKDVRHTLVEGCKDLAEETQADDAWGAFCENMTAWDKKYEDLANSPSVDLSADWDAIRVSSMDLSGAALKLSREADAIIELFSLKSAFFTDLQKSLCDVVFEDEVCEPASVPVVVEEDILYDDDAAASPVDGEFAAYMEIEDDIFGDEFPYDSDYADYPEFEEVESVSDEVDDADCEDSEPVQSDISVAIGPSSIAIVLPSDDETLPADDDSSVLDDEPVVDLECVPDVDDVFENEEEMPLLVEYNEGVIEDEADIEDAIAWQDELALEYTDEYADEVDLEDCVEEVSSDMTEDAATVFEDELDYESTTDDMVDDAVADDIEDVADEIFAEDDVCAEVDEDVDEADDGVELELIPDVTEDEMASVVSEELDINYGAIEAIAPYLEGIRESSILNEPAVENLESLPLETRLAVHAVVTQSRMESLGCEYGVVTDDGPSDVPFITIDDEIDPSPSLYAQDMAQDEAMYEEAFASTDQAEYEFGRGSYHVEAAPATFSMPDLTPIPDMPEDVDEMVDELVEDALQDSADEIDEISSEDISEDANDADLAAEDEPSGEDDEVEFAQPTLDATVVRDDKVVVSTKTIDDVVEDDSTLTSPLADRLRELLDDNGRIDKLKLSSVSAETGVPLFDLLELANDIMVQHALSNKPDITERR